MPDLATLQADFVRAILGTDRSAAGAAVLGDAATAGLRLGIYRTTALSGLSEALRLTYPITERVVGAAFFEQSALAFAREAPPEIPVLALYGADFPDFLRSLPALAELPYVADIARLDWAVDQAGLAPPGHRTADRSHALATERGTAAITLAPSLRLLRLETSARDIWLSLRAGDEDRLADLDWRQGPQWLAVHHQGDDVEATALTPACWRLCDALFRGDDLETAISTVAADPGEAVAVAGEFMNAPFLRIEFPRS